MSRKERTDALNERVDAIIGDLQSQLAQGHTQDFLDMLKFYADRFATYSPTNWRLIQEQNPGAVRCAGYHQWQKLGCQVRRGEKAIYIRGPWLRKETDPQTGDTKKKLIGYVALAVYDIAQVDGADKLPSHRHPLEGDYEALYTHIRRAITEHGIEVVETTKGLSVLRRGVSYGGRIEIYPNVSTAEKCQTLLHEAGHEVLHPQQDRPELSRRQMELEAESLSLVLCNLYGLDNPASRDYIISWRGTPTKMQQSLSRIHQAVKQIAGWLEFDQSASADAA